MGLEGGTGSKTPPTPRGAHPSHCHVPARDKASGPGSNVVHSDLIYFRYVRIWIFQICTTYVHYVFQICTVVHSDLMYFCYVRIWIFQICTVVHSDLMYFRYVRIWIFQICTTYVHYVSMYFLCADLDISNLYTVVHSDLMYFRYVRIWIFQICTTQFPGSQTMPGNTTVLDWWDVSGRTSYVLPEIY